MSHPPKRRCFSMSPWQSMESSFRDLRRTGVRDITDLSSMRRPRRTSPKRDSMIKGTCAELGSSTNFLFRKSKFALEFGLKDIRIVGRSNSLGRMSVSTHVGGNRRSLLWSITLPNIDNLRSRALHRIK